MPKARSRQGGMLSLKILKSRAPFPFSAFWDVFCALIWMIWLKLLVPLFQDFKHLNHCILTLSQPKGNLCAYFEYFLYWFVSSGTSNRGGRTPAMPYAGYATVCLYNENAIEKDYWKRYATKGTFFWKENVYYDHDKMPHALENRQHLYT